MTILRHITDRPVQLRAAPEGNRSPGTLVGYAAVFGSPSRDLGGWREVLEPGAFGENGEDGTLDLSAHTRVLCRAEHDSRLLLGTTDSATLRLAVDETGLRYEVDLPNTGAGRDAAALAERGDYRFSSFAFHDLPDGWDWSEGADGTLERHVRAVTLVDVAPVADPAYWAATVAKRDLIEARASIHGAEAPPQTPAEPDLGRRDIAARLRLLGLREGV